MFKLLPYQNNYKKALFIGRRLQFDCFYALKNGEDDGFRREARILYRVHCSRKGFTNQSAVNFFSFEWQAPWIEPAMEDPFCLT